jgi:DNA-binding CsgD family transcriptional regulator
MEIHEQVLDVVEHIYDAAADPGQWPAVLDRICATYPASQAVMVSHDAAIRDGSIFYSARWPAEFTNAYNDYYASRNPWVPNILRRPVGLAAPMEFMVPRTELLKTEFYNDFLRPQGLISGIGVTLLQDEQRFVAAHMALPDGSDDHQSRNAAFLQRLASHLKRAMQVNRQLMLSDFRWQAAEASLNRIKLAVLLLTGSGRMIFANTAANHMLQTPDGLWIDRGGRIKAHASADEATLKHSIRCIANGTGDPSHGIHRVHRPSGAKPFNVLVAGLKPPQSVLGPAERMVALFIGDPDRRPRPAVNLLMEAFGVTRAEGKLLDVLLQCHDVTEAANRLHISPHTARTQLRQLFAKLDCSRQAELLQTVTRHPLWFASAEE